MYLYDIIPVSMFIHIYNNLRNVLLQLVFDNPSPSIRGKLRLLNITELFICFLAVFILVNKIILNFIFQNIKCCILQNVEGKCRFVSKGLEEGSGRVLDSRLWGYRFEPHWGHQCVVSLSKTLYSLLSTWKSIQTWLKNCWLGHKELNKNPKRVHGCIDQIPSPRIKDWWGGYCFLSCV